MIWSHFLGNRFAQGNVKYALEVNEGWFKKNNLFVGDVVNIESISNDK